MHSAYVGVQLELTGRNELIKKNMILKFISFFRKVETQKIEICPFINKSFTSSISGNEKSIKVFVPNLKDG